MTVDMGAYAFSAALLIAWGHGVYSYIQMVRNRRPGVSPFALDWRADRLTARGLVHRQRVLWSWGVVLALFAAALLMGVRR